MLDIPTVIRQRTSVWIMQYQKDLLHMWKFLHERWSATTTFIKATVRTTFNRRKYTGQPIHKYVVK